MNCCTRKTNCFTRETLVGANRVRIHLLRVKPFVLRVKQKRRAKVVWGHIIMLLREISKTMMQFDEF